MVLGQHTDTMTESHSIYRPNEEWTNQVRTCDHPNCTNAAEYRAPRSREELRSYYWFCLIHVRDYNKAWNFYAGMDQDQIESEVRHDTVWQRPSWPLGVHARHTTQLGYRLSQLRDHFGLFSNFLRSDGPGNMGSHQFQKFSPESKALATMNLYTPLSLTSLKARYKELAKRLHPDTNGGDPESEERLKEINEAYETLRKAISS